MLVHEHPDPDTAYPICLKSGHYSTYIGPFHIPKWLPCALIEQFLHADTGFDTRIHLP